MTTDARDGRTSGGVPVTDDVVEQLADEAEAGYDVPTLRRRGGRPSLGSGPAEVVPVRIDWSCGPRWLRGPMRMRLPQVR